MAKNMMAFPELRHPFEESPLHAAGERTVLYQGRRITVTDARSGDGLVIPAKSLTAINGFTIKPEGACLDDLCIPLNDRILLSDDTGNWIDLEAFADHVGQPCVADRAAGVWSFGEIPARRQQTLLNARAPEFEVTDRNGKVLRLADLKGKKALIVTWSSW